MALDPVVHKKEGGERANKTPAKSQETPKLMEVFHDETPSMITDHKFSPRGEWFTLCKHCGLSEAAHAETELRYYSDDNPSYF